MANIISQKTSLLDSATGPVVVTTTAYEKFDIDDYVSLCVQSKAEYLRLITKAKQIDPSEVAGRAVVTVGDVNLGGFDAV